MKAQHPVPQTLMPLLCRQDPRFWDRLSHLAFVITGAGKLARASELFDPNVAELQDLLEGGEFYPSAPFLRPELVSILIRLGLKTSLNRVGVLKQRPRMPPFIGTHASRVATMIRQCLHHDPSKRPTAENLVEAQMEMVNTITKMRTDSRGPVRESSVHEMSHQTSISSDHSEEQDAEQFWTSAGKFTLHPNRLDSDSGTFSLTVNEVDANEWMENAL